jgi:hypothetical protein
MEQQANPFMDSETDNPFMDSSIISSLTNNQQYTALDDTTVEFDLSTSPRPSQTQNSSKLESDLAARYVFYN